METEYSKGTGSAKIKLAFFLLGLFFIYFCFRYWWDIYIVSVDVTALTAGEINEHFYKIHKANLIWSGLILLISIYLAIESFSFGKRTRKSLQYPPPGSDMPFTIKIVRGRKAITQARALYAISIMLVTYGLIKLGASVYSVINGQSLINAF